MLSRGAALLVLAWTLVGVSTIVVGLRFLARWIRLGRLEIDDYCMLVAVLAELTHTALLSVAEHYGLGQHIGNLSPSNEVQAMKYITIQEGLALTSPTFGRISFAIFLIMLLGPTAWVKRYLLYFIVGSQVIINVVTLIQIYAQCGSHPSALWDPAVARIAHCESPQVETIIGYIQSAFNSFADLILTITPSVIIWELNLPRKAKIGLSIVLGLSLFALAASIAKAVEIQNLSYRNDFTYNMVTLQVCSVIENNTVMIAASIPKLRPLWKKNATLDISRSSKTPFGTAGTTPPHQAASLRPSDYDSRHEMQHLEEGDKYDESNESKFGDIEEDGITKTVDVEIAYRNGSASSSSMGEKSSYVQRYAVPEFLRNSRSR